MQLLIYQISLGTVIGLSAFLAALPYKDHRSYLSSLDDLQLATLAQVADHCATHTLTNNITHDQLILDNKLPDSFNNHDTDLSLNLSDYPNAMLVTEGRTPFKAFIDNRHDGNTSGTFRENRFNPDDSMYRSANPFINLLIIEGRSQGCATAPTISQVWNTLCPGIIDPGLTCNPWN